MSDPRNAHELLVRLQQVTQERSELITALQITYGDRLYRSCQNMSSAEANDVVQKTIIKIAAKIHTYDATRGTAGSAVSWMDTIRSNIVNDLFGDAAHQHEVLVSPERLASAGESVGAMDPNLDDIADVLSDDEEANEKRRLFVLQSFIVTVDQLSEAERDELRRGPSATKQRQGLLAAAARFREVLAGELTQLFLMLRRT